MIRAGHNLRFTPDEIEGFRKLGLDFDGARTQDDVEQVLTRWADTLNDKRPDLLDRLQRNWPGPRVSACPRD